MSRYILVPTAEGTEKSITTDLVCDVIYEELKNDVINKQKLKRVLEQLARNQNSESEFRICPSYRNKHIHLIARPLWTV